MVCLEVKALAQKDGPEVNDDAWRGRTDCTRKVEEDKSIGRCDCGWWGGDPLNFKTTSMYFQRGAHLQKCMYKKYLFRVGSASQALSHKRTFWGLSESPFSMAYTQNIRAGGKS